MCTDVCTDMCKGMLYGHAYRHRHAVRTFVKTCARTCVQARCTDMSKSHVSRHPLGIGMPRTIGKLSPEAVKMGLLRVCAVGDKRACVQDCA